MQQLLHICSEHFDSKEKEEDKDKKDKKEKEKKESSADMGAHQVGECGGCLRGVPGPLWDWSWGKAAPSWVPRSPCPAGLGGSCRNLALGLGAACAQHSCPRRA